MTEERKIRKIRLSGSGVDVELLAFKEDEDADVCRLIPRGHSTTKGFADGVATALKVMGASLPVQISARVNIFRLVDDVDERKVFKNAKALAESFSAKLFGSGGRDFVLRGHFKRWCHARIFRGKATREKVSISESLFACRFALGYASDIQVLDSLDSHRKMLESDAADCHSVAGLLAVSKILFKPLEKRMSEIGEKPNLMPSPGSRSGFGCPTTCDGKVGYLFRSFHGVYEKGSTGDIQMAWEMGRPQFPSVPVDELQMPSLNCRMDHACSDPGENDVHTWNSADSGVFIEEALIDRKDFHLSPSGQLSTPATYFRPVSDLAWDSHVILTALSEMESGDSSEVKVIAVKELSKVRVVTSGSPACATVAKNFQQSLFDCMKSEFGHHFVSLRQKVTSVEIDSVLSGVGIPRSSDFQGATNLIPPELTNPILLSLCKDWPTKDIIMDDNADKVCYYPRRPVLASPGEDCYQDLYGNRWAFAITDKEKKFAYKVTEGNWIYELRSERPKAVKKNGQFMGQNTSFPLLCLVNFLVSFTAFIMDQASLTLDDLVSPGFADWGSRMIPYYRSRFRAIFNGDDRLRKNPQSEEDKFWSIGAGVGLFPSVGKCHAHPRFAVINAQRYFLYRGEWCRVGVLRTNLILGKKKLETDIFRASEVVTAAFEGLPFEWSRRLVPIFLHLHGSKIDSELSTESGHRRSLFLPCSLGGMGQVPPPTWRYSFTDEQIAVADRHYYGSPFLSWDFGPLRGHQLPKNAGGETRRWEPPRSIMNPWEGLSQWMVEHTFDERVKFVSGSYVDRKVFAWECPVPHCPSRLLREGNLGSAPCECGFVPHFCTSHEPELQYSWKCDSPWPADEDFYPGIQPCDTRWGECRCGPDHCRLTVKQVSVCYCLGHRFERLNTISISSKRKPVDYNSFIPGGRLSTWKHHEGDPLVRSDSTYLDVDTVIDSVLRGWVPLPSDGRD